MARSSEVPVSPPPPPALDPQQPRTIREEVALALVQARRCERTAPELPADTMRRLLAARES